MFDLQAELAAAREKAGPDNCGVVEQWMHDPQARSAFVELAMLNALGSMEDRKDDPETPVTGDPVTSDPLPDTPYPAPPTVDVVSGDPLPSDPPYVAPEPVIEPPANPVPPADPADLSG